MTEGNWVDRDLTLVDHLGNSFGVHRTGVQTVAKGDHEPCTVVAGP